ncbi:MAG: NAD-dependent dehydratase [Candidatus Pelagibacter sp. TMED64]|nr:NAD-dependent dehydratase [Candidatus Pelagibacter sp.]OUU66308.1 MAG: NAD-dependent dehydratase [Candidatus Pelagibacter sp. TMED64]
MRTIVTGGAGFIGCHLVEKLITLGHEVIVIDNLSTGRIENLETVKNQITFVNQDLSKDTEWQKYFKGIDWVIHLAALADIVPSIKKPNEYFQSNVVGTLNILEASKKYNIKKLIYSASSSCYGIPDKYPTNEDEKINPQYPYALTKLLGEQLVMHWSKLYGLNCISLRFFNVYGTRSRTSGTYGAMFGVFLAQKIAKKPFTIVGDGKQKRDFTYVSDIIEAIIFAANSSLKSEIFNVGSGESVSVNKITELLGGEKVYIPKRPGEPDCTFADITKIQKYLKWQPKINIEEGVKKLINEIKYWQNAPVWTPDSIKEATKDWFKFLG